MTNEAATEQLVELCRAQVENAFGVRSLVLARANVNATCENGASCLQLACERGHYTIARLLLHAGANPMTVSIAAGDRQEHPWRNRD